MIPFLFIWLRATWSVYRKICVQVILAKHKETGKHYALKVLEKRLIIVKNEVKLIWNNLNLCRGSSEILRVGDPGFWRHGEILRYKDSRQENNFETKGGRMSCVMLKSHFSNSTGGLSIHLNKFSEKVSWFSLYANALYIFCICSILLLIWSTFWSFC